MANGSSHLKAWVSEDTKQRFAAMAAAQGISESALLNRTITLLLQSVTAEPLVVAERSIATGRDSRLSIRLRPDDQRLLKERSLTRGIPAATYVAALVRSHLTGQSPLPKKELGGLLEAVRELRAIGRNLNQIARAANQGSNPAAPSREDLRAILKACEALRDHVRSVVMANLKAWEVGYAETSHQRKI
jgi:hypothetical protein